jgi:ABC-type sugar transport system ATPase subunit
MVFQNYALFPHLNVFDNIAFGLQLHGVSKQEIRQRVEHAAALLHLEGMLTRKPRQLSGGPRSHRALHRQGAKTLPFRRAHVGEFMLRVRMFLLFGDYL